MARFLAIPVALVLLLAGAVIWSSGGVEGRADFAFINRGDIFTLDLNHMSYMQDFRLTFAIREGLYGLTPVTYRPTPAGATGYDLSGDKRIWTFHLRPSAKWSNGDPVRAQDYVFSWRRMLEDPGDYTYLIANYVKNGDEYVKTYAAGKPIDFKTVGIQALDDLTFRVTLNDPVPYLLDLVAFPPFYPRHEKSMEPFKKIGPDGKVSYEDQYTRPPHVVTNGPFVLKRWDFKRRLILEKSPTYWDADTVKIKRMENVVNENPLTQFLQYETGGVDWITEVPAELAAELKAKNRPDLKVSPAFGTAFLTLICRPELPAEVGGGKNPMADVRVRQAMAMAIDKRFIVDQITRMGELPARTYLPPDGTLADFTFTPGPFNGGRQKHFTAEEFRTLLSSPDGYKSPGPGLPYDPEKARALLAEAGYPNGRGFPALPILFNSENQTRARIAQRLKSEWKENLNIEIRIEALEGKIFKERTSKKQYAIATVAWYGDYPDASTFTDKYLSNSLNNDSAYEVPRYDELCAKAAKEPDVEKRNAMLEEAENMLDTEMPIIPLYHYVNVALIKPNVKGVDVNPRNATVFKIVGVER